MRYLKLFLFGGWSEKYQGHVRPLWLVPFRIPFWLLYKLADGYVKFMDRNF